ncbi:hypothetical protein GDO81_004090 [Engystomops pustulosus]|uniref:Uncharacterized protein n=1 Tax=Engystomops pustulosus TaxID=76066 RepID=A0AAV6ZPY4_ENGPU|nr:hypothetical protein GDO81_004090 [Engystomops pustulosus]
MAAASGSLLHGAAEALGASEAALRLILSILSGYPLALFQRYFLFKKQPSHIHLFNTVTGLCIAYFNFGMSASRGWSGSAPSGGGEAARYKELPLCH